MGNNTVTTLPPKMRALIVKLGAEFFDVYTRRKIVGRGLNALRSLTVERYSESTPAPPPSAPGITGGAGGHGVDVPAPTTGSRPSGPTGSESSVVDVRNEDSTQE